MSRGAGAGGGAAGPGWSAGFLAGPSVEQMCRGLKPQDHLCLIYETYEEWRAAITAFVGHGLRTGERCVYLADTHSEDEVRRVLAEGGVDVRDAERAGRLVLMGAERVYLSEGRFDPARVIAFLKANTEQALAEGYSSLRVTGEMGWSARVGLDPERLLEYEARLNSEFFASCRCCALCQYERALFGPEVLKLALMTHPMLVYRGGVYRNPYYISPDVFLGPRRAASELQHWLDNVARQHAAVEALRLSEERFRLISESALVGIYVFQDDRFVYVNPALASMFGYSQDELIGRMGPLDLTHPEDRPQVVEQVRRRLAGEVPFTRYEFRGIHKDGKVLFLESYGACIEYGGRRAILGTLLDITARKRFEEELHKSLNLLRAILDAVPLPVLGLDTEGRVQHVWNRAAETVLGWKAEEVMGRPLPTVPEEKQEEFRSFRDRIRQGLTLDGVEVKRRRRDGSEIEYSIYASPLRDANDQIIGNIAVLVDLTERRRTEAALRDLAFILNHSPAIVFRWRAAEGWPVEFVSENVRQIGYSPEDFHSGRVVYAQIVHPEDLPRVTAEVSGYSREPGRARFDQQYRICTPDGRVIWLEDHTWIRRNEKGEITHYEGIVLDITERKQAELRVADQLGELRQWFAYTLDREERVLELKREVDQLLAQLGQPPRYGA